MNQNMELSGCLNSPEHWLFTRLAVTVAMVVSCVVELPALHAGNEAKTLKRHGDAVWSVAFSPNGDQLASASFDRSVRLWNARTGEAMLVLKGHATEVLCVAFSPDGKQLATGSRDKTIKLWNIAADLAPVSITITTPAK